MNTKIIKRQLVGLFFILCQISICSILISCDDYVDIVPKGNTKVIDPYKVFRDSRVEKIFPVESETYTEMQNTYFTPDRERRRGLNTKGIEPYQPL